MRESGYVTDKFSLPDAFSRIWTAHIPKVIDLRVLERAGRGGRSAHDTQGKAARIDDRDALAGASFDPDPGRMETGRDRVGTGDGNRRSRSPSLRTAGGGHPIRSPRVGRLLRPGGEFVRAAGGDHCARYDRGRSAALPCGG